MLHSKQFDMNTSYRSGMLTTGKTFHSILNEFFRIQLLMMNCRYCDFAKSDSVILQQRQ